MKTCFVISPIGSPGSETRKHADDVLEFVISPAAEACGYKAMRADQLPGVFMITNEVIGHLIEDDIVVAVLTGHNPNVFYELAVRHAVGKPVVQLILKNERVPFDIGAIRTVKYELDLKGAQEAIRLLTEYIGSAAATPHPSPSPLSTYHNALALRSSDNPAQQSLLDLVDAVSSLRDDVGRVDGRTRLMVDLSRHGGQESDSVFAWRSQHYRREKRFLAEQFVAQVLGPRIEYLQNKRHKDKIRIIFDSGSTIAPILDVLGREAEADPGHWVRGLDIVTNSIKAVEYMLRYREVPHDRYAELPIRNFHMLPGKVLAAFEAIADETTLQAVDDFRTDDTYTIAVTTGNYILLHEGELRPIARAGLHPDFKATVHSVADEVYVVAPLGKILTWTGAGGGRKVASLRGLLQRVNRELKLKPKPQDLEVPDKSYHLVDKKLIWTKTPARRRSRGDRDWLAKTVLVTTKRTHNGLFHEHGRAVERRFGAQPFRHDWSSQDGPYQWATEFIDLPLSRDEQFQIEVPHANLRTLAKKFFTLPSDWPKTT